MKFPSSRLNIIFAAIVYGAQEQQVKGATPSLSSYTENPNSNSIPMVPAPMELVGLWNGSNCGLDDPEPVNAELEMAENGVNIWYFADSETSTLVPQTGAGVEVIVGYQCIDIGKGYWWGQVPYNDVLWCNLFQVEEVDSGSDNTKLVSYTNLAYGGQGVGAMALGACPTSLTTLETSMKPLQASFMKKMDDMEEFAMTCNVPAGSKDQVQPSLNSQFSSGVIIPNPFDTDAIKHVKTQRSYEITVNYTLPVMIPTTCQSKVKVIDGAPASGAARSGSHIFSIIAAMASLFSWIMA